MEIKVKTKGGDEFDRKMRECFKLLKNTRPLMKSLGITVKQWIDRNYKTDGGLLEEGKWAPLAKSTIASRRKGSSKPLQDTGKILKGGWSYNHNATQTLVGHNNPELLEIHNKGTGPYDIRPKTKKALRFVVSGYTVGKYGKAAKRSRLNYAFAKYVRHPGIKKRRQLPNEDELRPGLIGTADFWLKKAKEKSSL